MGIFIQGAGGGGKGGRSNARKPNIQKDSVASTSRFKGMYILSEGEVEGFDDIEQQTFLEGTPLADANGNPNFQGVSYAFVPGTNDQDYIQGFPDVSNEIGVNVELRYGTPWVKAFSNTQLSAIRVRVKLGRLSETNSENGDVTGTTVKYAIDLQTDNGAYTTIIDTQVSDKASAGYERTHRIDLPKARNGWQIRVRRLTPNSDSDLIQNDMFVDAVAEVIDAKLRYPNTAMFAIQYDAETFSSVAKIAWLLKGKRIKVPSNYDPVNRTYTGLWNGTYKIAYSNNPAWVYYDLLTQWRYGLGERIDASMIDKWSLYQLGHYCDEMVSDGMGGQEPRFTCNVYLQKQQDAFNVLSNIAGVFRAMSYWNGEQIVLDADIPQDPVYTFSRANVIDGVFKYTGSRARDRHTLVKVAWSNPANNFETEYLFVRDEKGMSKYGVKVLDMSAFACTSQAQAQRAGLWALKTEQLETRQVSFAVGLDGFIPQVGNIINISDELFAGRANSGRVSKVDGTKITLDRAVDTGDTLIINGKDGKSERRTITAIDDKVVTVNAPFDNAESENIWAIESADLKLMRFRIMSITQNEDMTFSITALQHEPQKYDAVDYGTHVEPTPITVVNPDIVNAPDTVTLSSRHRIAQGLTITTLVIEWSQVKDAVAYEVEWRKDDGSWITLPKTSNTLIEVDGVYSGNYQARVRSISAFDVTSQPRVSNLTAIKGKAGKPPSLAKFTATGVLFGMHLEWGFKNGSGDADYVEIEQATAPDTNVIALGEFSYPTNKHDITGMQGNLKIYYRARLVDKLGFKSDWTDWTSGTTDASADKVLDLISGEIEQSHLNKTLSTKIEKIGSLDASVSGLNNAFSGLDKKLEQAKSDAQKTAQQLASDVERVKKEADAELTNQKQLVTKAQSDASKAIADVVTESSKRKQEISSMQTGLTQSINQVDTKAESAITKSNQALTKTGQNAALIASNATASTNADSALSKRIDKVVAVNSDNQTAITNEVKARTNADSALGQRIGKVESTANNNVSRIGVLETTTSNNKEAIANTRTDLTASFNSVIDEIEIGGRNLIKSTYTINGYKIGSDGKLATSNEHWVNFNYQDPLVVLADTTYTFSMSKEYGYVTDLVIGLWSADNTLLKTYKHSSATNKFTFTTTDAGYLTISAIPHGDATKWKLEKGNKATDWTPAPEDVDSAINANTALITAESKTRATALEATGKRIDAVVTSVGNANTAITNETNARSQADSSLGKRIDSINTEVGKHKSSITNLSQAISDANKSISTTATQLRSETQTAIDSLEIGGRNLLLDSNAFVDANTTKIINGVPYRLIGYEWGYRFNNVKLHGTYTASVMVHNPNDVNAIVRITSFSNSLVIGPGETKLVSWTETFDDFNNSIYFLSHSDNTPLHFSYAKLEKGNKATDWTPAPEDVQADIAQVATESNASIDSLRETVTNADKALGQRIDSVESSFNSNKSSVSQQIKTLTNTDNATAQKLSALDSKTGAHQSKIRALEKVTTDNTQAISTTHEQLSAKFDSLEIGGRNLLKNSEILHDELKNGGGKVYNSIVSSQLMSSMYLEPGIYTFSCEMKATNNPDLISIRRVKNRKSEGYPFFREVTSEWQTFKTVFNVEKGDYWTFQLYNHRWGDEYSSDASIRRLKVERGNKATDWTPAPEDVDASIAQVATESNANINSLRETVTNADKALSTRIDSLDASYKQADSNLTSRIASEERARANGDNANARKISTLQTTVNGHTSSITNLSKSVTDANNSIARVQRSLTSEYTIQDTRNANNPPNWYFKNYPHRIAKEFKYRSKIGLTGGTGTYCYVETQVRWSDSSGGAVVQTAYTDDGKEFVRQGFSAWSSWVEKESTAGAQAKIDTAKKELDAKINKNSADIRNEVSTRANAVSAVARSVDTLQTTVGRHTASIQTQQSSIDGLSAQSVLTLDVNGYVTGVGSYNDGKKGTFAVRADEFWVAAPNGTKYKGFVYYSTAQNINGTVVPRGMYLDNAFIANGSIDSAKIKNAAITSAKIGKATIESAHIKNAQVDTLQIAGNAVTIPSARYYGGSRTWQGFPYEAGVRGTEFQSEIGEISLDLQGQTGSVLFTAFAEQFILTINTKPYRSYSFAIRIIKRIEEREDEVVREMSVNGYSGESRANWTEYFLTFPPFLDESPPKGKVTYVIQVASSTSSYVTHWHSVEGLTITATGVKR